MSNTSIYLASKILSAVGALNWGLIGLFNFNLVSYLFGENSNTSKAVYILVGASSIVLLTSLIKDKSKTNH